MIYLNFGKCQKCMKDIQIQCLMTIINKIIKYIDKIVKLVYIVIKIMNFNKEIL